MAREEVFHHTASLTKWRESIPPQLTVKQLTLIFWRNSAYCKAFRGKFIMSTSDMIILESCGCIGNTTWSVWIEKYHRKPHVCIHLLKQNGDLWTTIWNKWCKEGKIFNTKWKCCCQGEGILVLHLNIILPSLQHYFQYAVKWCWEGEEVWKKML